MEEWVPSYLWNDPNFVNWWDSALDSERMAFIREQNKQNALAPVSLPAQKQQSEITARPEYQYNDYKDYSKEVDAIVADQKSRNDWMANALTLMNGATSIFNTSKGIAQTADTSQQRGMIQDIGNIGSQKFGNYGQAISAYDRINSMQPDISFDTYRGGSTKERVGGVLSNTITGATTGAQVGGLYGGIAGGVIGLGAGIGSWIAGDYNARANMQTDNARLYLAQDRANLNTQAGIEDLQNDEHRNKIYNLGAEGGKIERKNQSLQEFADKVLKNQKSNDVTRSSGIVREKVEGGTKIRIKR